MLEINPYDYVLNFGVCQNLLDNHINCVKLIPTRIKQKLFLK